MTIKVFAVIVLLAVIGMGVSEAMTYTRGNAQATTVKPSSLKVVPETSMSQRLHTVNPQGNNYNPQQAAGAATYYGVEDGTIRLQ